MPRQPRIRHLILCSMIGFGLVFLGLGKALPQDAPELSPPLKVGVMNAPPSFMQTPDHRWEGLSVELWEAVAQNLGLAFVFREFESPEAMLDAFKEDRIDIIPSLAVRARYEAIMDFSHVYLKSGLSIAVPSEGVRYRWGRVFESLLSAESLKAIGLLLAMSAIAGGIVWWLERRRNPQMFGGATSEGIGQGIWWAVVTMTTVGYGDKAPKTMGGRCVALAWMIFSVVFIASYTATITTSLTVGELRGKIHGFSDLYDARVGAIPQTEGFQYLARQGITVTAYKTLEEGLEAVDRKQIDAFVHNELLLKYMVKNEYQGRVQVLPEIFDEYFVSMGLQYGFPLRRPVNKALLNILESSQWKNLLKRYAS
jgi:polar amino acid transport system substrate-binding protein